MMKKMLPLLLGLAVIVSGCLSMPGEDPEPVDGDDANDMDQSTGTDTGDTNGNGDATGSDDEENGAENETVNQPPTASLVANLTEGRANLTVKFDLDGDDPDGDALSWVLDLGDGNTREGTELPTSIEHTYTQAGNITATLTISDGTENATAMVDLTVLEALAPVDPVVFEGSALVVDPFAFAEIGCLAADTVAFVGSPVNPFGGDHSIEPTLWGWSYKLTGGDDLVAEFLNDDFEVLTRGNEGEVPNDADYVIVCIEGPTTINVDYVLTLTP